MDMPRCRSWAISLGLASAFICINLAPRQLQAATPEEVDAALVRARAYVYSKQQDGIWDSSATPPSKEDATHKGQSVLGGQWGGPTALAVYALLASGESPQNPKLSKAIKFLKTVDIKGIYALGVRSQMYSFLPGSVELKRLAVEDMQQYQAGISPKSSTSGMFQYLAKPKSFTRLDHSVSQFGVLGAWACEKAGAEVDSAFWQKVEEGWIRDQNPRDGSWTYSDDSYAGNKENRASMVVAGVATLFITQDYLHSNDGIKCAGNVVNPHIELGMKWIGDNFDRIFTDKGLNSPYYAIFGLERVGVASGRKYFGNVNWYERGADFLIGKQVHSSGDWTGGLDDTCLAMLFLSRGRAPVIFNKLQYDVGGKEGNWNQRPRDIANLTHWIGQQTERDLNWQIVSLKGSIAELLDAPVLYLSGNKPLQFTIDEEKKLRSYCEAGGLILANPDCGNGNFTESFRRLGGRLFPAYSFRELPAGHPIYTSEQYPRSGWKNSPSILSLSNGVREMMVLEPASDPARHWQTQEVGRYLPDYELADDIFLYAIDKKNLQEKGKTFVVEPDNRVKCNRAIKLANLQYNGNWDPEPGGWQRLSAILHNTAQIDLQRTTVKLGEHQLGDGKNGGPKIATLTGTGAIKLDPAARLEIKNFVEGGGTLIVDAAGGNSEFAVSVEAELQTIFGVPAAVQLKISLPSTAEIFHLPGGEITDFRYRTFARSKVGSLHSPLLSAITINNRPGVYYSRVDMSAGLVGCPTDGIIGYDPATATAIMTNLMISSGLGPKASVTPNTGK